MLSVIAESNPLLTISVVLVSGVALGELAKRFHLPAVTGQILVGILIGPSVLALFDLDTIHGLRPLIDFALGLMAVEAGSHLYVRRLKPARRRLLLLLAFEITLTPLLVFFGLYFFEDTTWYTCLLLATIAISTAPATILAIVKDTHSKGVFVKTLVAAVALNNLACICLFEIAHTTAAATLAPDATGHWLLAPLWELVRSSILGCGVAVLLVLFTRHVVRADRLATASLLAILLTVGLAQLTGISTLLACLSMGVTLANLTPDKEEIGHGVFANFDYAIFAVFFTVAGMELQFRYIVPAGLVAVVMFLTRFGGKLGAAYCAMRLAGATDRTRRYLGFALIPQAGLAVGLMLLVTEDPVFVQVRDFFLAVVLTVVLANELCGPILTRLALSRSGDLGKDRARLIDFLHEEHILTNLHAESKEEAITQLTDHLIRTTELTIERDQLLTLVLDRENLSSTCLGDGLAVPHAQIENGASIVGVMGISSEGLRFKTPDGHLVHCMVLLVTPTSERTRHLEVLAALARTIMGDRTIQQQLYHARTPAHAYELLHAEEESEDFNYFLEEDDEEEA